MSKLVPLMMCTYCGRPVGPRSLRRFRLFSLPVCQHCYHKLLAGQQPRPPQTRHRR